MKSRSLPGLLILGLSLVACSTETPPPRGEMPSAVPETPGAEAPVPEMDLSGRPGLVVARSVFRSGPSPATMLVLRGGDRGWERVEVSVPPAREDVQIGSGAAGRVVMRQLDESQAPASGPLTFVRDGELGPWTFGEAGDAGPVEWQDDDEGGPLMKAYELEGGNVFHKCMWFEPAFGEPGILTISANMPYLQIWRDTSGKGAGSWESETLWTAVVGGREQRFRDVEAGDVDGDGQDELVLATHDLGAVYVLEQTPEGLVPTEVHRTEERTFVHEVEIGDADGDGKLEFFTTPSEPNRLDGSEQAGGIAMYRWNGEAYDRSLVASLTERHAKEILVTDLDGDGRDELYAALEAEGMKDTDAVVLIRTWRWQDGAMVEAGDVPLEGRMCRFLNTGDTDGDGIREIIASTRSAGLFVIEPADGSWTTMNVVSGDESGGFEHATVVMDWDGDGKDELFVGSDKQKKLRRFWHDPGKEAYAYEDVIDFKDERYVVWTIMPLPPRG